MATVETIGNARQAGRSGLRGETRILLSRVPWTIYETLRNIEANNRVRMTYLDGSLELMSPGERHERFAVWFGLLVIEIARVLGFPIKSLRSTTWKQKGEDEEEGKGKEADDCFYIASFPRVHRKVVDLSTDPPPDLAVEVEISHSHLDMMQVYAGLKVPEVWRFDGETLSIQVLRADGTYRESDQSPALPYVKTEEVEGWMRRGAEIDEDTQFCEEVRAWALEVLMPRYRANRGE